VTVPFGPKAQKLGGQSEMIGELVTIRVTVAPSTVQSVVSDDEQTIGVDNYRVIVGTHDWNVPVEWASAFSKARGWDGHKERRFRVPSKRSNQQVLGANCDRYWG
jgi:hypothetical protein